MPFKPFGRMEIDMYKTFSGGLLSSNTHVVWDEDSRECMIVDCGNPAREIARFVSGEGLTVKYVILTHSHFDHAHYISDFASAFPEAQICAHKDEVKLLCDPEANVSIYFGTPERYPAPDRIFNTGDRITLGKLEFSVLCTPGHTPGSICLYCKSEKLMLTGDTLFECGRGRCDFKYGSEEEMAASLHRLLSMDTDILFLSGHGAPSYIGDEVGRVY